MFSFYVWDMRKRKRYIYISIVIIILIGLFLLLSPKLLLNPFSSEKEVALIKGNKNNNKISLTFNMTWGDEKVIDILKVLKKHDVKATFFLNGEWAERHPHIVQQIQDDAHEVGALGYRYESYVDKPLYDVKRDMELAKEVFKKVQIDNLTYFRAPSGHMNEDILTIAEQQQLEMIHWSVQVNDWKSRDTEKMVTTLQKEVKNGDIILLHASDAARKTADILEEIIPYLKKEKYQFATISELMYEIDVKKKSVQ